MSALEEYLASDFIAEKQEITTIDRMLREVASTFAGTFDKKGKCWPYEHKTCVNGTSKKADFSQGNVAMALCTVGRLTGECSISDNNFTKLSGIEDLKLDECWKNGFDALLKDLKKKKAVCSNTFGKNNVLTISQLSELKRIVKIEDPESKTEIESHLSVAKKPLTEVLEKSPDDNLIIKTKANYYQNAFIPLRALQAAKDLEIERKKIPYTTYQRFFESALHDHLSFSSIPDSRFDPAELIFCLEGLLLCASESVDATLLNRVLQVLGDKQSTSSHWRPNKPFIAHQTGAIQLPISVEGANSLMRSIKIMDEDRYYDTFTEKALPLITRFWSWLRARSVSFKLDGKECVGWHSEHVNEPDLIHIWDTSQVAAFMFSYKSMLERHMATKTLELSRLDVKRFTSDEDDKNWDETIEKYEPLKGGNENKQVYLQAKNDFIKDWKLGKPTNFSILLYGPPGTGKSTLPENMSKALKMPFITVTVSDFLGMGGANVEARAKAIFQTLEAQKDCVILFDEIDSFLLDRNSKLYKDQDSLFQFLTPGMLTKINDLRKCERSIFIIATNYVGRIDPAIKRAGRIDKKYLLPLPNEARRLAIFNAYRVEKNKDRIKPLKLLTKDKTLGRSGVFFGFSDLNNATKDAEKEKATIKRIETSLKERKKRDDPIQVLRTYLSMLKTEENYPKDELESLISLAEEVEFDLKKVGEELNKKLESKFINLDKEIAEKFGVTETNGDAR